MCQAVSELIKGRILCQSVSGSFLPSNSHYDKSPGNAGNFRAQALGWLEGSLGVALGSKTLSQANRKGRRKVWRAVGTVAGTPSVAFWGCDVLGGVIFPAPSDDSP